MSDQVTALEREISVRRDQITQLQIAIDQAADTGDVDTVKTIQSELAAGHVLLESALRRLEKARQAKTETEKRELVAANQEAVKAVAASLRKDAERGAAIERTIQTLAKQVIELNEASEAAVRIFSRVFSVFPANRRTTFIPLVDAVGSHDVVVARLEEVLARTNKFGTRFGITHAPDLADYYANRVEKLTRSAQAAVEQANAEVLK